MSAAFAYRLHGHVEPNGANVIKVLPDDILSERRSHVDYDRMLTLKGSIEGRSLSRHRRSRGGKLRWPSADLKWVNPEVAGRYGIMVLTRCGSPAAQQKPSP